MAIPDFQSMSITSVGENGSAERFFFLIIQNGGPDHAIEGSEGVDY